LRCSFPFPSPDHVRRKDPRCSLRHHSVSADLGDGLPFFVLPRFREAAFTRLAGGLAFPVASHSGPYAPPLTPPFACSLQPSIVRGDFCQVSSSPPPDRILSLDSKTFLTPPFKGWRPVFCPQVDFAQLMPMVCCRILNPAHLRVDLPNYFPLYETFLPFFSNHTA